MEGEEVGEGKVIGVTKERGKRRSRRRASLMSRGHLAHHVDSEI